MPITPYAKRVLIKLSGESLSSSSGYGLNISTISPIITSLIELYSKGIQIALVIGGGNFLRGSKEKFDGKVSRSSIDQIGMLATIMNSLALRDLFHRENIPVEIVSSKKIDGIVDSMSPFNVKQLLESGHVVIFAGGTGNPFVTTDSCSSLRAIEIDADAILKATTVDGIYDLDPSKYAHAKKYNWISFDDVIKKELAVMDLAAFTQCRDFNIPICVFNMDGKNNLNNVLFQKNIGTWVSKEKIYD